MVNEDPALLNRPVTQVTPAALFNRRLHNRQESYRTRPLASAVENRFVDGGHFGVR